MAQYATVKNCKSRDAAAIPKRGPQNVALSIPGVRYDIRPNVYSTPETAKSMATRADDPTNIMVSETHLYS